MKKSNHTGNKSVSYESLSKEHTVLDKMVDMNRVIALLVVVGHFFCMGNLAAQNPPGENFDLSAWKLQTVEESDSSFMQVYPVAAHSSRFFYTDSVTNAMVFRVPSNGGTTSTNARYPRTELRQMTAGANWLLSDATEHYMSAQCRVTEVAQAKPKTIVGQIHGSQSNSELLKIRWTGYEAGDCFVEARFQTNDDVGSEYGVVLASGLSLGDTINYTVTMAQGVVNVTVNGESASQTYTSQYYGTTDRYYFKAGNYIQWNEDIVGPTVVSGESVFHKLSLENDMSTSVAEGHQANSFLVYPNPAKDYVVLDADLMDPSSTVVELIDAKGSLLQSTKLSPDQVVNGGQYRIDLSNLKSGVYYVRVASGRFSGKRKLVVFR